MADVPVLAPAVRAARIDPHLAAAVQAFYRAEQAHTWRSCSKTPTLRDMLDTFPALAGLKLLQLQYTACQAL